MILLVAFNAFEISLNGTVDGANDRFSSDKSREQNNSLPLVRRIYVE